MPRILLVAPDSDLRKSLEFALRMEGYDVASRASIGAHERPDAYDCAVVDHHGLGNNQAAAAEFCRLFAPAILLTNHPDHPVSSSAFRTLLKPLLGAALTDAVGDAILARATTK